MRKRAAAFASKVSAAIGALGLSNEEVGDLIGASPRSVARWIAGEVVPRRPNQERLLELTHVIAALAAVLPADQAGVWIFAPNRLLGHRTPADLIRNGQFMEALDLIDAMAEGVFV
jgi:Protein of unknown function (DUF2384)/Helix-turn-helix